MANENKSSAEAYRERRKKQIAQAAKKSSKYSAARNKAVKIAVTVVSLLIAFSLVAYSAGSLLLNVFGLPQRLITVNTVDGYKITAAEFNYYYSGLYNDIWQYSKTYEEQYASSYEAGMGAYLTGYDFNKSPSSQKYVGEDEFDEFGEDATWADYFKVAASRRAYITNYFYEEAMKKEYTLPEDELKAIDKEIDEIRKTANENDFSLKRYLSFLVGEGVNESLFRKLREKDKIALNYQNELSEEYNYSVTEEEIQKLYEENKENYDSVYFRLFAQSFTTEESEDTDAKTKQEAKAIANKMLDEIETYKDFNTLAYKYAPKSDKETYKNDDATAVKNITYTKVSESINKDLADWLFDKDRSVNDKTVILDESGNRYFIACVEKTKTLLQEPTVNVRHILIQFDNKDEQGNEIDLTQDIKNTAKSEIDAIYNEWKDGEKTVDSFAALAETRSEDRGSKENGGLYENVYRGQMVTAFEDWCYDPARKNGDTGIIETSYGYHLMYFVGRNDEPHWKFTARSTIGSQKYSEFIESLYKKAHDSESPNTRFLNYFTARLLENINRSYASSEPAGIGQSITPDTTKAPAETE